MWKLYTIVFVLLAFTGNAQLIAVAPEFPKETDAGVVITLDATKGNQGLKDYNPNDVYIHIGCITTLSTSSTDWKYSKFTWATTDPNAKLVSAGSNKFTYTLTGTDMRAFYGITNGSERILKIACVFRSGDGTRVQRNTDGSDIYAIVYDAGLQTRITNPFRQPTYLPTPEPVSRIVGDNVSIQAKSSLTANLKLLYNGTQVAALNGTTITANPTITTTGSQRIIVEAENGGAPKRDTLDFFVNSGTVIAPLPAGLVDGINYEAGGTALTLVLYAPLKTSAVVLGDFNNWTQNATYQMNQTPDGTRFWLRITGLTPGTEYGYQYLIDGTLKVADYNTEKILDPNDDRFIPASIYPGLKPYPTGLTSGNVSVFQTNKPAYTWSSGTFNRPDKKNLMVYELLLRDFLAQRDWKTLNDTLTYLKRLGVNAIEVMPFNEFEGNSSWGYNTAFYFAPDKAYGPENELRRFIDSCHKKGIAVIMDMTLNHSFGQSPMVQMYWDAVNNRPAANSPWFNPVAKHAYNVGYDINHESQATKEFVDRVTDHWLNKYRIDGFRWDLAKGFTQKQTCDNNGANCDENAMAAYDAGRVAILKRIYDKTQVQSPGSYCILELFAQPQEEQEYSNYGMMMWGNANFNFNEATMGYLPGSNFQGIVFNNSAHGFSQPHLVGYAESHDEERLNYKNVSFGNSANASHDVKTLPVALKRLEMSAAFLLSVPGPKMILQFAELGYDKSIMMCTNGTVPTPYPDNTSCKLSEKPTLWNYQTVPERKALYNAYSKLFAMRNMGNLISAWKTSNISYDFSGGFKRFQLTDDSLRLTVIGNFDVNTTTGTVTFQNPGTWYSYMTGTTRSATGSAESITLQPGEYYVYTNRDLSTNTATPIINPANLLKEMKVQVYPNPVSNESSISFNLPESGNVHIAVINQLGQSVGTIYSGYKTKGSHTMKLSNSGLNVARLQKGNYHVRFEVNGKRRIDKFLVL
ncbi:MAG: alpha-amylase family glycosyl hydrolase [Bacteroidota bacterium]